MKFSLLHFGKLITLCCIVLFFAKNVLFESIQSGYFIMGFYIGFGPILILFGLWSPSDYIQYLNANGNPNFDYGLFFGFLAGIIIDVIVVAVLIYCISKIISFKPKALP